MDGLNATILGLATPLALGLTQLLKGAGVPARWAGLTAFGVGLACGALLWLAGLGGGPLGAALVAGAVAGLTAAGVWSGVKAAGGG
jgi:hypothetical protein